MRAARARAILDGRAFVTHADVQEIIFPVLGHRLILQPEAEVEGRQVREVIDDLVARVPVTRSNG
jgi:MoxR-like ATPase